MSVLQSLCLCEDLVSNLKNVVGVSCNGAFLSRPTFWSASELGKPRSRYLARLGVICPLAVNGAARQILKEAQEVAFICPRARYGMVKVRVKYSTA